MKDLRERLEKLKAERAKTYDRQLAKRLAENEAVDALQAEEQFFDDLFECVVALETKVDNLSAAANAAPASTSGTGQSSGTDRYPLDPDVRARIRRQQLATMISSHGALLEVKSARTISDAQLDASIYHFNKIGKDDDNARRQLLQGLLAQHHNGELRLTDEQIKTVESTL